LEARHLVDGRRWIMNQVAHIGTYALPTRVEAAPPILWGVCQRVSEPATLTTAKAMCPSGGVH